MKSSINAWRFQGAIDIGIALAVLSASKTVSFMRKLLNAIAVMKSSRRRSRLIKAEK
jgi:hypothetical protein